MAFKDYMAFKDWYENPKWSYLDYPLYSWR